MPPTWGAALGPIETSFAVWIALLLIKGLAVLVLAEVVIRLCRRSSASVRHLIRTASLVALVVLPIISWLGPRWEVALLTPSPAITPVAQPSTPDKFQLTSGPAKVLASPPVAPEAGRQAVHQPVRHPDLSRGYISSPTASVGLGVWEAARQHWLKLVLGLWLAGVFLLSLRLVVSFICIRRTLKRALPVTESLWMDLAAGAASRLGLKRPVRLLIGQDMEVALSVGLWESVVLLPQVAQTWSLPRLRSILLHELAHAKRRDNLSNLAGQLACVLHWPNPLVWAATRRLIVEREKACDDEVLATGARPSEYAGHLLEIARAVATRRFWGRLEISQSSALKDRFKALLDPSSVRHLPGPNTKALAVSLSAALILPLSAFQPWTLTAPADPPGPLRVQARAGFVVSSTDAGSDIPGSTAVTERRGSATRLQRPPAHAGTPALAEAARPAPRRRLVQANRDALPSDEQVADHRAWPLTRVITSGGYLSPAAARLWAEGPPHLIWGTQPERDTAHAPSNRSAAAARLIGGSLRTGSRGTVDTDENPGAAIQPAPTQQAALHVEVQRHELGTLGGAESLAKDINEAGMVVGRSKVKTGLDHPFLWTETSGMIDLGSDLQTHSRALEINEAGRVLFETFNSLVFRGYVWTLETGALDLGALSANQPFTLPSALSERNHVVGGSRDDSGILRAFLWTPEEGMLDLGAPEWSEALAVNDSDQVVGYSGAQAFLWDRSQGLQFIGPPKSMLSIATDINNQGQVVGYADFGGDYPQAFIWQPDTGAQPLGTVGPEFPISFALSIDERGQVLGRSVSAPQDGLPEQVRIFRWTSRRGLEDLGPIADDSQLAVNALGQIVAAYSDGSAETERSLAIIWTEQGAVTVDLNAGSGDIESRVAAVNSKGQVVGSSLSSNRERRAMLWDIKVVKE